MKVLHFKQIVEKVWLSSVPNGLVEKKRFYFTYIYGTYVRTFEQEEEKGQGSACDPPRQGRAFKFDT